MVNIEVLCTGLAQYFRFHQYPDYFEVEISTLKSNTQWKLKKKNPFVLMRVASTASHWTFSVVGGRGLSPQSLHVSVFENPPFFPPRSDVQFQIPQVVFAVTSCLTAAAALWLAPRCVLNVVPNKERVHFFWKYFSSKKLQRAHERRRKAVKYKYKTKRKWKRFFLVL